MKTKVGFQFVIFQDPKVLVFKARVSTVSEHNTLRPESDVELRMRRANQLNETRNKLCSERG